MPGTITKLGHRADRSASFNYDDREFAAGNSVIPDKLLLYEARALIPSGGTFRVITGSRPIRDASGLTVIFANTFATYFLMPRRPSSTAPWVLCLGCDPGAVGPHVQTIWSDDAGSSLLRLEQ
jgi:hypothetical protein